MFHKLLTRRKAVTVAAVAFGLTGIATALGGASAGAAVPNASLIVGSGSQTSYGLMTQLGDLFNGSSGCDLTASTSLPLQLNCGTTSYAPSTSSTPNQGEQGFPVESENPYNDYTVQAPAIGSTNGKTQLTSGVAGVNYARSSSGSTSNGGITTQQNFVEYATDGVSWTTFSKVGSTKTDQAKVTNLTTAQLQSVYNDSLTCTVKGTSYKEDWICLGAKKPQHIDCYISQTGSGTFSTWSAAMGFSATSLPACLNDEASGTAASHENQFENQMSSIATQPDAANALYFMSYGKYTTTCPGNTKAPYTNGKCAGATANLTTFGNINGVTATQSTIQGSGGGVGVTFPVTRGLYNIYNNSSASGAISPSNQATLNFVSEKGFLCKPGTASDIDQQTGVSYRSEIEADILAQGFFPIDASGSAFSQGTLTFPASITDPAYSAIDPSSGATGYCLVKNG
jgi:hypothetical protein